MFSQLFYTKSETNVAKCIQKLSKTENYDENMKNKYQNICKIINNIEIADNIQVINEYFTEFMHMWFNDNAVINEIYRHLNSRGICVLHEIVIWYNIENTGHTIFAIPHHYGYDDMPNTTKSHNVSYLDVELYYNTQIKECKNNIMAIPITIHNEDSSMAHSNMLIIKRENGQIIVEHFEPYGNISKYDSLFEITQLMYELFAYEINSQNDVKIISVLDDCSLQRYVLYNKYRDSCAMFSIWYAIMRLLNPEETYTVTREKMRKYLLSKSPTIVIKSIISAFMLLIDINDAGIINNKKTINKGILKSMQNAKMKAGSKSKTKRKRRRS